MNDKPRAAISVSRKSSWREFLACALFIVASSEFLRNYPDWAIPAAVIISSAAYFLPSKLKNIPASVRVFVAFFMTVVMFSLAWFESVFPPYFPWRRVFAEFLGWIFLVYFFLVFTSFIRNSINKSLSNKDG
jgi:hypothetical protein